MNKLALIDKERNTIDTREVADMMGMKHYKILEKLEGTKDGKTKGIIPVLNAHDFVVVDYFMESTYVDVKGETRKCYLCTKMGCEFLANKFTGEKGILFTAHYVKRFNEMEKKLSSADEKKMLLVSMIENGVDPSEIARYTALVKDSFDGENMIITCGQVVDALNIEGLTTTIFNKWLEYMGLGEYVRFEGEKKKVFQPNDEYIKMFVKDGMAVTGTTFKRDKVKCVYTTKLVNTIKENYIDNLRQYVKIATIY